MGGQLAQEKGMQTISVLGLTKTGYVMLIKFEKPVGYVQVFLAGHHYPFRINIVVIL